jgi:hypothetical protein
MSNATSAVTPYCDGLDRVYKSYHAAHGHVSVTICILGIISNTLVYAVQLSPELVTAMSPLVTTLTAAKELVILEYIPFAIHMYVLSPPVQKYSYPEAIYQLFHIYFKEVIIECTSCI